jgi:PAS domain-containing protein
VDYFQGLRAQIRAYLIFVILAENLLLIGGIWYTVAHLGASLGAVALGAYGVSIIMTFIITFAAADYSMQPLQAVWQAVVHLEPREAVAAPDISKLVVGRVLVSQLTDQIYQIASVAEHGAGSEQASALDTNFIASSLPLPLFVLNAEQVIVFANRAACTYLGRDATDLTGKDLPAVLNMSFASEQTLADWLEKVKSSNATAATVWERVRLDITDTQPTRLFDLAAY